MGKSACVTYPPNSKLLALELSVCQVSDFQFQREGLQFCRSALARSRNLKLCFVCQAADIAGKYSAGRHIAFGVTSIIIGQSYAGVGGRETARAPA